MPWPSGMGPHLSWTMSTPLETYWLWVHVTCQINRLKQSREGTFVANGGVCVSFRCSLSCSSEPSALDRPPPTSRPLPAPVEPRIKSTLSLTKYVVQQYFFQSFCVVVFLFFSCECPACGRVVTLYRRTCLSSEGHSRRPFWLVSHEMLAFPLIRPPAAWIDFTGHLVFISQLWL